MNLRMLASAAISGAIVNCTPAQATLVNFTILGKVSSVEYNYDSATGSVSQGGAVSDFFLANAPIGTAYQLNYSIDTDMVPYQRGPGGASFYVTSGNAGLTIGSTYFSLPSFDLAAGAGFAGQRYSLFGNFLSQPSENIGGLRALDLSVEISGSTTGSLYPPLTTSLSLADFPTKYARARFTDFQTGETGIIFSIDSFSSSFSAVPEPESWALIIVGFYLVGGAIRRHVSKSRTLVTYLAEPTVITAA